MSSEIIADTPLGEGAEFQLIRRMRARWGELAIGIGDDAAVIDLPRGERLVVSTDTALEGVHFRHGWLSPMEIGYRAVTAALSDLAAMAADPHGVLVSLQLPSHDADLIDQLADGIGDAARAAGTVIRGGNLSRADVLGITTTVLGSAFTPLSRRGARPGDLLYLTGALGAPAATVRMLESGSVPDPAARARFARPSARLREARWLASRGAIAAIDLSDGLRGDAGHLAAASGVACDIQLDRIPIAAGASADDVFGGEEYELLVAARTPLPDAEFQRAFAIPLSMIGRITEGARAVTFTRAGARVAAPQGHDHFSR